MRTENENTETGAARQQTDVRDQKIPNFFGDGNMSPQRSLDHLAAIHHKKCLDKAESALWRAQHLLVVLGEYLDAQDSDECHRASIMVEQVEKAVDKAAGRISLFGTDHANLFIAYCEQKRNGADTAMSSQTTLRSHQIACEALSVEECLRRLKRHDWLAYAEDEDWTLQQRDRSVKGLQYFLAELEFLQELTHGDDRGFREGGAA